MVEKVVIETSIRVLVGKKDSTMRMCVDFRLDKVAGGDPYPCRGWST